MLLARALSILWPARCAGCGVFVAEGLSFCPPCESTLVALGECCPGCAMPLESEWGAVMRDAAPLCGGCSCRPFPFQRARAALAYGGAVTQAILSFKHGGHRHLAVPLARYLLPVLSSLAEDADVVCPVPLHRDRLKARGFNQALELVRAANSGVPSVARIQILCDVLARTVDTPALGHHSAAARERAVAGAFQVPKPVAVDKKHVLVVDDVMTSGATLAECARTLLTAGARAVSVAALARAL
jgi:ComF family protein